jgi:predicted permease
MLRMLFSRILGTIRRQRVDEEFDAEIRAHLEMLTDRFIARGMSPDEARCAGLKQFGGVTQVKEDWRDQHSLPQLDVLAREIRHAFRQLWKAKWFTASATLTIGLGIGATTAVFSIIDAVLLRPLPFAAPDRLVAFGASDEQGAPRPAPFSYPEVSDFRLGTRVFDSLLSYRDSRFTLTDSLPAADVLGEIVSWNLFSVLGVQPELGRGFLLEEETSGRPVVILSHSLWMSRFHADREILGRAIRVNGRPVTVVGVARADFQFPLDFAGVQLWVTTAQDRGANERGARMLNAIGRLKTGVSIEQVRQQLSLVARRLADRYPEHAHAHDRIWVETELERLSGDSRRPLWVLFASVALLPVIGCANVANLLIARSTERSGEFVLRAALGASRPALIRQMVVEGAALGVIGAAQGILFAWIALRSVLPLFGDSLPIPRILQAGIDGRALEFSVAVAFLTSVMFSLAPALDVIRAVPAEALKKGSWNVAVGRHRVRSLLVIGQIALGIMLLIGAEVLIGGYLQMTNREPGFRTDHLLAFDIGLAEANDGPNRQIVFGDRVMERLRSIPGVKAVASGQPLPLQGHEMAARFDIEGRPTAVNDRPRSDIAIVTPGYFHVMGMPLRKGRDFTDHDTAAAIPVAIVNEAFARKFFPGESVIGKRIKSGAGPAVMREIIGLVGNARQGPLGMDPGPICYFAYRQLSWSLGTMVVRTAVPPLSIEPAVRAAVSEIDRRTAISRVRTGEELSTRATTLIRLPMVLMVSFAAVALMLTVTGLYGVLSYTVSRRQREIGIRMALGAERTEVLWMVLRNVAWWVTAGSMLGCTATFGMGYLLRSALLGVRLADPIILAGACLLMAVTSFVAAYLPAAQAASVDPVKALRNE